MLIKTEVRRRTQAINQYILSLKQKIYNHRFKQAKHLLKSSQQSINNSYMAPYDPNAYLFDSLKSKNQKLRKEKQMVEKEIIEKLQQINQIKLTRGFTRNSNQISQNVQFIVKMYTQQVDAYISRLPLKMQDVQKIDYENIVLQTNFHFLRIIIDEFAISFPFNSIISTQNENQYILICWRSQKNTENNYIILKFWNEDERRIWTRCINFSKLVFQSQQKTKLFYKQQPYPTNINPSAQQKLQDNNNNIKEMLGFGVNKYLNLNINSNKTSAFDRLRRKSQLIPNLPSYAPTTTTNNLSLINRSKSRKVSEDLTMKQTFNKNNYFYEKKLNTNNKSQKSFEDDFSPPNSSKMNNNKQQIKKQIQEQPTKKLQITNNKIQKLIQEREKLQSQIKLSQNGNTQSNRQIFFNQSSIHWIQQQNEETYSKSSGSKNMLSKKNFSQSKGRENSEHISQAPAQRQESPLLPYSMRNRKQDKFQVRLKQVSMTGQKKTKTLFEDGQDQKLKNEGSNLQKIPQFSHRNKRNNNQEPESNQKENSDQKEQEYQQSEQKQNQIQSINEQSQDQQSEEKSKKIPIKIGEVEDKSQDLPSQNQNSQTQSRKYGLDDLISGIILLKCSPNGWKPHIKKLHLSNNNFELCWKNQKGDDLKRIKLSEIESVDYNSSTITEGILKHIKNIQKKRCFVIKYRIKNTIKLLQFYLPVEQKVENLQNFYLKLNSYVRFKNSMQL